jgi:hypothetical protein
LKRGTIALLPIVIAVFMGTRMSGGYSVKITGVEQNDKVTVKVKESSPPPDAMVTMALTSPYHVVVVPKSDKPVEFVNQTISTTHALPADATATVIVFDYSGGMLKPQNDDPLMVIRADGSVTLGNRYKKNARIETKITKDDLQALLRMAIDTNDFFKINAAEIEQSLDAKLKRENEKLAAKGIAKVGPRGISDAATTAVRIHADGKDHEVQYYALDMHARDDERLTRLQNIATRLRVLEQKLRAEAPAAAPPGKAD